MLRSRGDCAMLPLEIVGRVAAVCEAMKCPYFVTGSVASSYWGVYRSTHDADIVIEIPSWHVDEFCGQFPRPDWYVDAVAALEAVRQGEMFNIVHEPTGFKV